MILLVTLKYGILGIYYALALTSASITFFYFDLIFRIEDWNVIAQQVTIKIIKQKLKETDEQQYSLLDMSRHT